MIFDIYEQPDLFRIAKCGRQATLVRWLSEKGIPYTHDAKGKIIAHKRAVEAGLGVEIEASQGDNEVKLYLGDDHAA